MNLLEEYLPLEWVCFFVVCGGCHFWIQVVGFPSDCVKKIAGCTGGLGHGNILSNGIGSGGGHGGSGGDAWYNDNHVEGGSSYGDANLPCELGSGSGSGNSTYITAGGGIISKPKFMFGLINVSL